jgi:predicted aspartyl protease
MLRRHILVAGAALIACAAAGAEPTTYFEGPKTVTLALRSAVDGKLYLTVPVMGRNLVMFLDTGASTVLDLRVARAIGVPLIDTGQTGYGLTGVAGKRISTHVDLRLGALKLTNLPVDCLDLTELKALSKANGMPEFDGVIGAELLKALRAKIDFERLTLTLRRPG